MSRRFWFSLQAFLATMTLSAGPLFGQSHGWRPSTKSPNVPVKAVTQSGQQRAETGGVDEFINWLPLDTESVIFARGPYPQSPNQRQPPANANVAIERPVVNGKTANVLIYVDPKTGRELGLVNAITPKGPTLRSDTIGTAVSAFGDLGPAYTEQILRRPIKATLAAARRFGAVSGIPGGTPYEGCHVIVFEEPLREGPVEETSSKLDRLKIGQTDVMRLHTVWGDEKIVLYFAHPKANVLVAATDREFLATTLERMLQPGASRALPRDLPEWRHVNVESAVWGVRHVHDANVKREPAGGGLDYGLTFSFDERASMVVVRYLSTLEPPDRRLSLLAQALLPDDRQPVRVISPDVAEVRFRDHAGSSSGLVTAALMGWLVAL